MFGKLGPKELEQSLNDLIDTGFVKKLDDTSVMLTNKGEGKVTEYVCDLTDVLMEAKDFKSFPREYVLQIAVQSVISTFGSKIMFMTYINAAPNWREQVGKLVDLPIDELQRLAEGGEYKESKSRTTKDKPKKDIESNSVGAIILDEKLAEEMFDSEDEDGTVIPFLKKGWLN